MHKRTTRCAHLVPQHLVPLAVAEETVSVQCSRDEHMTGRHRASRHLVGVGHIRWEWK